MLCFINIGPLPLAKNNLERRQKKFVGNISACSSNNMGESQSQLLRPFGPAVKKQPANLYVRLLSGRRGSDSLEHNK